MLWVCECGVGRWWCGQVVVWVGGGVGMGMCGVGMCVVCM